MTRRIIRVDGTEVPLERAVSNREVARLIGAETLDTVALRHLGHPLQVMMVDDAGWETEPVQDGNVLTLKPVRARKPVNEKATALYHANCIPGTTHQVVGDVAVVFDDDYAPPQP